MNNEEWGVTERGFHRPTYVELLNAIEYKARELFGDRANLTVRSPLGLFLRVFAWILNILFSLMEDVYNSRFVDTAVGTSLYNLGKAIGLSLLPAQKATGYVTFTGTAGTVIPSGFLVKTVAGLQYAVMTEGRIESSGTVTLPVQAVDTGSDYNASAGTVTEIVNPLDGVASCSNSAAVDGGRGRETDEEFRDRYYQSVDYAGGVNADSIRAALLQNVDGIMEAKVFENDTDDVDDYGLPPHSIEAVVYGGLDSDIAQIIYKELGAGIQTTGQKVIEVITASGATKAIHFNRPHPVPVYVKVVGLSTSGDFPHDGVDQLRAAIVAYIGDNESGGVSIGETLYHQRLPAVLYKVPGVLDFDVLIGTDAENLQADNIPVDSRSKVVTDDGMVTIDA